MIITGLSLSYLAWFGFYHSEEKRSAYEVFSMSKARRKTTQLFAWLVFFLALYPCAQLVGLERGIALWLALITGTGLLFIFSVQTHPSVNNAMAVGGLIVTPLSLLFNI
ncbi:DUF3325 domain-containing protein [Kordiimonas aquimaris]|uniref:DUF3325 domain-containing protein n=1 Tax=Kordiimonas aquimaris TaxID=707591 RepID=UPI0021D3B794|nr:DUF3325 domain-containing protein [Kordiimonas aquimaris]